MRLKSKFIINISKYYILYGVLFIFLCWPSRFAMFYYENISIDDIYENLIKETRNLSTEHKIKCRYEELFEKNQFFYEPPFNTEVLNPKEIRQGGEFWPENCEPLFSTAIIIPYRNRPQQLNAFLNYMHNFLRKQLLHYKIYIIEQTDTKDFNRAKLFNIGAKYALKDKFPCLIMQDIDLMPLRLSNIYACTTRPRHMSSSLDSFRYNLPYFGLFGGAVAINSEIFIHINGFSNMFLGWGGEDDDFYARLVHKNYKIIRFDQNVAQYTMLKHQKATPSPERIHYLKSGYLRYDTDGFNSLVYQELEYKDTDLFTKVLVEI